MELGGCDVGVNCNGPQYDNSHIFDEHDEEDVDQVFDLIRKNFPKFCQPNIDISQAIEDELLDSAASLYDEGNGSFLAALTSAIVSPPPSPSSSSSTELSSTPQSSSPGSPSSVSWCSRRVDDSGSGNAIVGGANSPQEAAGSGYGMAAEGVTEEACPYVDNVFVDDAPIKELLPRVRSFSSSSFTGPCIHPDMIVGDRANSPLNPCPNDFLVDPITSIGETRLDVVAEVAPGGLEGHHQFPSEDLVIPVDEPLDGKALQEELINQLVGGGGGSNGGVAAASSQQPLLGMDGGKEVVGGGEEGEFDMAGVVCSSPIMMEAPHDEGEVVGDGIPPLEVRSVEAISGRGGGEVRIDGVECELPPGSVVLAVVDESSGALVPVIGGANQPPVVGRRSRKVKEPARGRKKRGGPQRKNSTLPPKTGVVGEASLSRPVEETSPYRSKNACGGADLLKEERDGKEEDEEADFEGFEPIPPPQGKVRAVPQEEPFVDVETVSDKTPVIEAIDLDTLLAEFEATEDVNKRLRLGRFPPERQEGPPRTLNSGNGRRGLKDGLGSAFGVVRGGAVPQVRESASKGRKLCDAVPREVLEKMRASGRRTNRRVLLTEALTPSDRHGRARGSTPSSDVGAAAGAENRRKRGGEKGVEGGKTAKKNDVSRKRGWRKENEAEEVGKRRREKKDARPGKKEGEKKKVAVVESAIFSPAPIDHDYCYVSPMKGVEEDLLLGQNAPEEGTTEEIDKGEKGSMEYFSKLPDYCRTSVEEDLPEGKGSKRGLKAGGSVVKEEFYPEEAVKEGSASKEGLESLKEEGYLSPETLKIEVVEGGEEEYRTDPLNQEIDYYPTESVKGRENERTLTKKESEAYLEAAAEDSLKKDSGVESGDASDDYSISSGSPHQETTKVDSRVGDLPSFYSRRPGSYSVSSGRGRVVSDNESRGDSLPEGGEDGRSLYTRLPDNYSSVSSDNGSPHSFPVSSDSRLPEPEEEAAKDESLYSRLPDYVTDVSNAKPRGDASSQGVEEEEVDLLPQQKEEEKISSPQPEEEEDDEALKNRLKEEEPKKKKLKLSEYRMRMKGSGVSAPEGGSSAPASSSINQLPLPVPKVESKDVRIPPEGVLGVVVERQQGKPFLPEGVFGVVFQNSSSAPAPTPEGLVSAPGHQGQREKTRMTPPGGEEGEIKEGAKRALPVSSSGGRKTKGAEEKPKEERSPSHQRHYRLHRRRSSSSKRVSSRRASTAASALKKRKEEDRTPVVVDLEEEEEAKRKEQLLLQQRNAAQAKLGLINALPLSKMPSTSLGHSLLYSRKKELEEALLMSSTAPNAQPQQQSHHHHHHPSNLEYVPSSASSPLSSTLSLSSSSSISSYSYSSSSRASVGSKRRYSSSRSRSRSYSSSRRRRRRERSKGVGVAGGPGGGNGHRKSRSRRRGRSRSDSRNRFRSRSRSTSVSSLSSLSVSSYHSSRSRSRSRSRSKRRRHRSRSRSKYGRRKYGYSRLKSRNEEVDGGGADGEEDDEEERRRRRRRRRRRSKRRRSSYHDRHRSYSGGGGARGGSRGRSSAHRHHSEWGVADNWNGGGGYPPAAPPGHYSHTLNNPYRYTHSGYGPPTRYPSRFRNHSGAMEKDVEERRVIYVGAIVDGTTRADLRRRFEKFGPIVDVSIHFRERGDNYGFVTFKRKEDAYTAKERGNDDESLPWYNLCFGGRRNFCKEQYSDLDAQIEEESLSRREEPPPPPPQEEEEEAEDHQRRRATEEMDYDTLLRSFLLMKR